MFAPEMKERRYIPDDPYEKYNKMSFLKHKYSLEKNKKLIEEHGNKSHKFDRYRMHRDRLSHYNDLPKEQYLPPGELSHHTPPVAEILCVKNGRAIVVCGFLMK